MPRYDYKCVECGIVVEVEHGYDDAPTLTCENCGSTEFKKLIGNVRVIYKGSGWVGKDSALEKSRIPKQVWETAEREGAV